MTIDHAELVRLLDYNKETGFLRWKVRRSGVSTKRNAGSIRPDGYMQITHAKQVHLVHRLIWFYMTGEWPKEQIDHKNGIRNDNRWENLREASSSQNNAHSIMKNTNTTGIKGVSFDRRAWKYLASIVKDGKRYHIGLFDSKEDAGLAYAMKAEELFGEFSKADVAETRCMSLLIEVNLEDFE